MSNNPQFNHPDSPIAPSQVSFAIAPSDTAALPQVTKGIYVGTGGDITCRSLRSDADVTFVNVPTGYILDVCLVAIRESGTTAGNLIGLA